MDKPGFDKRVVSYEYIHSIRKEDLDKLVEAIDPQPTDVILDAMAGYGAVAKIILEKESEATIYISEESEIQIERAKKNLDWLPEDRFKLERLPKTKFDNDFFEKVVVKMGLHEVPAQLQVEILKTFHMLLKPNGRLIIWDITLNKETQELFQNIIKKKDELAGFYKLARERHFFREDELVENLKKSGFINISHFHTIDYRFSSKRRLEQELNSDQEKLNELNEYIRSIFPEDLKGKLNYRDSGDDIQFLVTKKIFTAST